MERAATPEETAKIKALIKEAVAAGAFGFTTTTIAAAYRLQGPSAGLPQREPRRVQGVRQRAQGAGQGRDGGGADQVGLGLDEEEYEFLDFLLTESGAPGDVARAVESRRPARGVSGHAAQGRTADPARRHSAGNVPSVDHPDRSAQPVHLRQSADRWNPVFNQPPEAQEKVYRDPGFRNAFREELEAAAPSSTANGSGSK